MAIFPTHSFLETELKYRFGERYISEATNKKFLGVPRGVYTGFTPTIDGNVLTMSPDATVGVSLARLTSQDDIEYPVDVVTVQPVTLDFTGHSTYPVNVVMRANGALGLSHNASIFTQVAPAADPVEILLCTVDEDTSGPSPVLTVAFDDPSNRSSPYAHVAATLGYGFMKEGDVDDLLNAVALTAEVEEARVDLTGTTQASLKDRLDADADVTAIADRLGKEIFTIQGDDLFVPTTISVVNISRSFSKFHRDIAGLTPSENISGFGSETLVGAVTSGDVPLLAPAGSVTDGVRNICAVIAMSTTLSFGPVTGGPFQVAETVTGGISGATAVVRTVSADYLIVDTVSGVFTITETITGGTSGATAALNDVVTENRLTDSAGNAAFGRLDLDEMVLDGTLTFDGTTTVTGAGTLFASQILAGDIIEAPNGDFYEVATTPVVNTTLTLTVAAAATTAGSNLRRRRYQLDMRTASESLFAIEEGTTIRPFFPMWRSAATTQFDYLSQLAKHHEPAIVPVASTTTLGKAKLAPFAPDGKAGSIFAVQQGGSQVGPSHVHTIDFNGVVVEPILLPHGVVTGGPYVTGETVTGDTSGATGFVVVDYSTVMHVTGTIGTFLNAETITGGTSGATAVLAGDPTGGPGSGLADVTQVGPVGPQGMEAPSGGAPGPVGPQGPIGRGIVKSELFIESPLFDNLPLPDGTQYSFSYNFNTGTGSPPGFSGDTGVRFDEEILFLYGGNSYWDPRGRNAGDEFDIIQIQRLNDGLSRPVIGQITNRVPSGPVSNSQVRFFLNAGGV